MAQLKLWIDDIREPLDGYIWIKSVNEAKKIIENNINNYDSIIINLDHDAGDYANDGGDYIKLLDWLEFMNIVDNSFTFHIHSMNPVGVQNMKNIIYHNGWRMI